MVVTLSDSVTYSVMNCMVSLPEVVSKLKIFTLNLEREFNFQLLPVAWGPVIEEGGEDIYQFYINSLGSYHKIQHYTRFEGLPISHSSRICSVHTNYFFFCSPPYEGGVGHGPLTLPPPPQWSYSAQSAVPSSSSNFNQYQPRPGDSQQHVSAPQFHFFKWKFLLCWEYQQIYLFRAGY